MKNTFTLIFSILITFSLSSQTPIEPEYGFTSKVYGTFENQKFVTKKVVTNIDIFKNDLRFLTGDTIIHKKIYGWCPATHGWTTTTFNGNQIDIIEEWSAWNNSFVPVQLIIYDKMTCLPVVYFN